MSGFLDGAVDTVTDTAEDIDSGVENYLDSGTTGDALDTMEGAIDGTVDSVEDADAAAEDWFASGTTRDAWDWVFDYEGEWNGEEDQHDIVGPSFDPLALFDSSSDESVFQYNSDDAEEDPTNPDNWPIPPVYVKWLVVLAVLAYVFGQLFDVQLGGGTTA